MTLVLIADDDPLTVDVIRGALSKCGYTVGALPDGRDLVRVVEAKRPALIILDCMMPQVSGIEALRGIRASRTCFDVPVLMLTARSSMGDQQIAMRAGASEYLRKPFDPDQLVAVVDCLLDERSRRLLSAGPPGLIA